MIINCFLFIIKDIVNLFLSPLGVINIVVDFLTGIPVVMSFIEIIAYILPWSALTPIFMLIFAIFGFRIAIALYTAILNLIPIA